MFIKSALLATVVSMFVCVNQSHATPVVLVSDIDDTIKITHVLDRDEAAVNSLSTDSYFRGMPALLTVLAQSQKASVYYLSNAPDQILNGKAAKFIRENGFPAGPIILRGNIFDPDHKIRELREIISQQNPQIMVLFGDNGEHDPLIYAQIVREFPRIQFFTYIHQLYFTGTLNVAKHGQPLQDGQMGYVTPIEAAMDLALRHGLSLPVVQALMDQVIPPLLKNADFEDRRGRRGEISIPKWQDCRDFRWPGALDRLPWGRDILLQALRNRLASRCQIQPRFADDD